MGINRNISRVLSILFILAFVFSNLKAKDEYRIEKNSKMQVDGGGSVALEVFLAGGFFSSELYKGLCYTIIAPYYFPFDNFDKGFAVPLYFQPYPYYLSNKGYLLEKNTDFSKSWVLDISSEYKLYEEDVFGYGFHLNLRSRYRFEAEGELNYIENNPITESSDSLILGNVNALFRFAQNPYLLMNTGLGLNMSFAEENHFGLNFTYSMDLYPIKPLFFSARIDLGRLGGDSLIRFKVMGGLIYKRVEINGGIEIYNIDNHEFYAFVVGLKYYF